MVRIFTSNPYEFSSLENTVGAGESVLLAYSPSFKIRYSVDSDLMLGCTIGCKFCYYRMIDSTKDLIGTGKLARLCYPEEFVEMICRSKLLALHPLVILGARGDASMYPREVGRVLEIVEDLGIEKRFLMLRRAPFSEEVFQHLSYKNAYYGTTITPRGRETGTPVDEEEQLKALEKVPSDLLSKISVEVGPITFSNVDKVKEILERLKEIGFKGCIYRGVSAGSWGIPRKEVIERLYRMGFLSEEEKKKAEESKEYFYAVKNHLSPKLEEVVLRIFREVGMKPYRHVGLFYYDFWKIPVAPNRRNKLREEVADMVQPEGNERKVRRTLEDLGFEVEKIEKREEKGHPVVAVRTEPEITEDVAMTVGAVTKCVLIAENYLLSPDLRLLSFYLEEKLLVPPEDSLRRIKEALKKWQS